VKDVLKQLLTGKDNATYDIGRVTWLVGFIAIISLAVYQVMYSTISLREVAEALGIVTGASGAAVAMKGKTEPDEIGKE
jgi:hypothetical protein